MDVLYIVLTQGEKFDLIISGWAQPNYFVRYDPALLRLVDAAAETTGTDIETGIVEGTPIEITEARDGYISFKFTGRAENEKLNNKMIFEGIQTGNTEISIDAY